MADIGAKHMKIRAYKPLANMECSIPIFLVGGTYDGAELSVAGQVPGSIKLDDQEYVVDGRREEHTGDWYAVLK